MNRHLGFLAPALLAAGAVACGGRVVVRGDVLAPVRTDRTRYVPLVRDGMARKTAIQYRFRNLGPDTLYIVNGKAATGLRLEGRDADRWNAVGSPVLPGCLSSGTRAPSAGQGASPAPAGYVATSPLNDPASAGEPADAGVEFRPRRSTYG